MPARLWAPSQISSVSPRRSKRPGSSTLGGVGSTARPRKDSAAQRPGPTTSRRRHELAPIPARRRRGCARLKTASFSAAICSRVSPRTSVWSSADVREHDDARVEHVRRVEPAAEPRLDDGDVDLRCRELGERGGGHHLELGRAERSAAGRTRSSACSRSASSPSTWIRSLQPRRAARCRRRRSGPRARGRPRPGASRSTCRSCRRRGSRETRAAGRRARPGARASAPARTPRARARGTRATR